MTEGLHERLVGNPQVLVTATGEHRGSVAVYPAGKRQAQLSGRRLRPHVLEPVQLVGASHETWADAGQEGGQRDRGFGKGLPLDPADLDRVGQPLQIE